MSSICLCGSGKTYERCCQPFLENGVEADHPEKLMRSRYVAYAKGGFGEYLLRTWFPATAKGQTAESLNQSNTEWLGLTVHSSGVDSNSGFVEFSASFKEEGELMEMHERSEFTFIAGRWFYIGGDVSYKTRTVGRNEPCPCGSGKKYKKCCMK